MTGPAKKIFTKGQLLLREGEQSHNAYMIESGNVEILIQRDGALIQIGTRGPGSIVGEMAMVDDKPRTATVRALDEVHTIEISRDDFTRRVDSADPILKMVLHVIMTRYRDMIDKSSFMLFRDQNLSTPEAIENSSDLHEIAVKTIKIHHELQLALERNELVLYYQPIIDLQKMKISGFEALMRWKHPDKGLIAPSVFIPVAEETGLIVEFSRWALEVSCDAIKDINKVAANPLFVSVNFSVEDFSNGEFFNKIKSVIHGKGVDPKHIHLEITESLLMEAPGPSKQALDKCREYGTSVSIDDFGTGYSSLSYLHSFPIDTLKIDQSFIRSMNKDPANKLLVKSIISLAHNLKMKVIAEGIENEDEAVALRELGCEECQGYWFARPMPLEDAIKFVQNWKPPQIG